jgi:hypothetical protein
MIQPQPCQDRKSLGIGRAEPGLPLRLGWEDSFTEEWVFAISFSGKKFIHFRPLNEKISLSA